MNHKQIMERHKFYEDNKEAILSDVQSKGKPATWRKWGISPGVLFTLLRRWGVDGTRWKAVGGEEEKEGKAPEEKEGKAPTPPNQDSDRLLELPAFSNDWTPEVQMKWLEIYEKLWKGNE